MSSLINIVRNAYTNKSNASENFPIAKGLGQFVENRPYTSRFGAILSLIALPIIGLEKGWNAQIGLRKEITDLTNQGKEKSEIDTRKNQLRNRPLLAVVGLVSAIFKAIIGIAKAFFSPKEFGRSINPEYVRERASKLKAALSSIDTKENAEVEKLGKDDTKGKNAIASKYAPLKQKISAFIQQKNLEDLKNLKVEETVDSLKNKIEATYRLIDTKKTIQNDKNIEKSKRQKMVQVIHNTLAFIKDEEGISTDSLNSLNKFLTDIPSISSLIDKLIILMDDIKEVKKNSNVFLTEEEENDASLCNTTPGELIENIRITSGQHKLSIEGRNFFLGKIKKYLDGFHLLCCSKDSDINLDDLYMNQIWGYKIYLSKEKEGQLNNQKDAILQMLTKKYMRSNGNEMNAENAEYVLQTACKTLYNLRWIYEIEAFEVKDIIDSTIKQIGEEEVKKGNWAEI